MIDINNVHTIDAINPHVDGLGGRIIWNPEKGKWGAHLKRGSKFRALGYFNNKEEAQRVVKAARSAEY